MASPVGGPPPPTGTPLFDWVDKFAKFMRSSRGLIEFKYAITYAFVYGDYCGLSDDAINQIIKP